MQVSLFIRIINSRIEFFITEICNFGFLTKMMEDRNNSLISLLPLTRNRSGSREGREILVQSFVQEV